MTNDETERNDEIRMPKRSCHARLLAKAFGRLYSLSRKLSARALPARLRAGVLASLL